MGCTHEWYRCPECEGVSMEYIGQRYDGLCTTASFTNASVVELSVVGRIVDKRRYWNQTRKDRKMKSLEQQNQELLNEVKLMMAKEMFLKRHIENIPVLEDTIDIDVDA